MAAYLNGQGVKEERLLPLQVQDWLVNGPIPECTMDMSVCILGELGRKRSYYLHELPKGKVRWHLYGDSWKNNPKRPDIVYHGGKADDLEGSFGLVWEGMSASTVTGAQGAYMMVTSPCKAGAYLTRGMPLIVWKWSALAKLVEAHHLGLVVDRVSDIPAALAKLSAEDYAAMAASARAWGEKLRKGDMTRAALEQIK